MYYFATFLDAWAKGTRIPRCPEQWKDKFSAVLTNNVLSRKTGRQVSNCNGQWSDKFSVVPNNIKTRYMLSRTTERQVQCCPKQYKDKIHSVQNNIKTSSALSQTKERQVPRTVPDNSWTSSPVYRTTKIQVLRCPGQREDKFRVVLCKHTEHYSVLLKS